MNKLNVTVKNMTIIYVDELKLGRGYIVSWMTGFNDLFKLEKSEIQYNSREKCKEFCLGTNN